MFHAFCSLFGFNGAKAFEFVFNDDFINGTSFDKAIHGVFDTDDISVYCRLNFASFEGKIGVFHFAILKHEAFAVAERLRSADGAVYKAKVFGVPRKVFALDYAVNARYVFGVPESVLGFQNGISDDHVFNILEGVFARHRKTLNVHVSTLEERILALKLAVADFETPDFPRKFFRFDLAAGKHDVVAFTKRLDAAENGRLDFNIIVIPQCGTAGLGHLAVRNFCVCHVPEGIAKREKAFVHFDIAALFERRFAVCGTFKAAG